MATNDNSNGLVDAGFTTLKAFLALLPYGSLPIEALNIIYNYSLEKRKSAWEQQVNSALEELKAKNESIVEELAKRDDFISLLISATLIAFKSHQKEKLQKLKNALVNSVDSRNSYDINQIYLQFVDLLTIPHIEVLELISLFGGDTLFVKTYPEIFSLLIEGNIHCSNLELKSIEITTFRFLLLDLQSKGLIFISEDVEDLELNTTASYIVDGGQEVIQPTLLMTNFGKNFLEFVKEKSI